MTESNRAAAGTHVTPADTIHRRRKTRGFTILDNTPIRREDLTLRARGLYALLFSLPDDWQVRMTWVIDHTRGKEGGPVGVPGTPRRRISHAREKPGRTW